MFELLTFFGFTGLATSSLGLALRNKFPARLKATAAPVQIVEPVLPRPALAIERAASAGRSEDKRSVFVLDDETSGRGHWERPARHRTAFVAKEKIMQRFVQWMIENEYSGWYTPGQVYEGFQEFAFDQRLEEISRDAFLSMLAVEPGVIKRRPYVQKNETYKHLRKALKGQDRATVYRIPTAAELAAVMHKKAVSAASACAGPTPPRARPDRGRQAQSGPPRAAQKTAEHKDLGLPVSDYSAAA